MKTILVVDDNKLNLVTARTVLSTEYRVFPVMKGEQALTYLKSNTCDLILLDINMPEMDGFEVLEKIREMESCRSIPVIFLTADSDVETETRCFNVGAVDFIAKPFVPESMRSRVARALELEELRRSLADRLEQKTQEVSDIKSRSQRDALTGLWDRAYTEETVNRLLGQGVPGALMMIDIDNFKAVNDGYGHGTGDEMLIALADTMRNNAAEGDVLCRLGGDEFTIFMRNAASKAEARSRAADIMAQMREKINAFAFDVDTSISIGVALTPGDGADFATLYDCADKALYYVKRNGKNSYHFFADKLLEQRDEGGELADLRFLQESIRRTDVGRGAYLLDSETFQYLYNFIRRYVDRTKIDVTMLLFTMGEEATVQAMEVLERTICTFLRRSDVAARYSNRQMLVILMDTDAKNSAIVVRRVLDNFNRLYTEGTVRVDCDMADLDDWPKQRLATISNMD